MGDDLVPITELFPPARQYAAEEWDRRTWWGRTTVHLEAVVVFIMRLMSHINSRLPAVYGSSKEDNRDG